MADGDTNNTGTIFKYDGVKLTCKNGDKIDPVGEYWTLHLNNITLFEPYAPESKEIKSTVQECIYDDVTKKDYKIQLNIYVTEKQAYDIDEELRAFLDDLLKKY